IGIVGDGNAGGALARGLGRAGHEVRAVGKDRSAVRDLAAWAEVVFLAVPYNALGDVIDTAGAALAGKTVVDVSNALDASIALAVGLTTSAAVALQKNQPQSRAVRAFNAVFASTVERRSLRDPTLTVSLAGADAPGAHTGEGVGLCPRRAPIVEQLAIIPLVFGPHPHPPHRGLFLARAWHGTRLPRRSASNKQAPCRARAVGRSRPIET